MYKKICLIAILTSMANLSFAQLVHCASTYQGQPFLQATIWSNMTGIGPAECDYGKEHMVTSYKFPKDKHYHPAHGDWRSTMPGFQWCSIKDSGNTALTCTFQLMETST